MDAPLARGGMKSRLIQFSTLLYRYRLTEAIMNALTKAFRTTCIPTESRIDTPIPSEYIGQKLEIIILPQLEENQSENDEIDLSPIKFDYIDYKNKRLRFKNNLVLIPKLDDSEQLYTISYPKFNLEAFAHTRQEIIDGIKSDIKFLWDSYAKAADSKHKEDALELKRILLSNIEELTNA
jgi:hypothetical protein